MGGLMRVVLYFVNMFCEGGMGMQACERAGMRKTECEEREAGALFGRGTGGSVQGIGLVLRQDVCVVCVCVCVCARARVCVCVCLSVCLSGTLWLALRVCAAVGKENILPRGSKRRITPSWKVKAADTPVKGAEVAPCSSDSPFLFMILLRFIPG